MIVEISIVPIGVGESLSEYVAEVIRYLEKKRIKYQLHSMGTIFEIENLRELGDILQEINQILVSKSVPRIYTVIKIDYRVKGSSIEKKISSVKEKL